MAPGKTNPSQSERARRQLRDAKGKFTLPSSSAVPSHLRGAIQPRTPASAVPRTRWAAIQAGTPSSSVVHRQHQLAPIQVDRSTSSSDDSTCDEKDDHDSVVRIFFPSYALTLLCSHYFCLVYGVCLSFNYDKDDSSDLC